MAFAGQQSSPLHRVGVAGLVGEVLGVVTGAVQTNGKPVGVVDVDHPAARCTPDLGVTLAERIEVSDPRLSSSPVGNRKAHRVEAGNAGRGFPVLPKRHRNTCTGQPPTDTANNAIVVGKLPIDGVAEDPFVPLAAERKVADRQLEVMDARELRVCHLYSHHCSGIRT